MSLRTSPQFTRLQAALSRAGINKPDGPFDDQTIRITCPTCNFAQTLGETPVRGEGNETYYRCQNDCQDLVIVVDGTRPPGPRPSAGQGYLLALGPYVIKNAADFFIPVAGDWLKFPSTAEFPK